MASTKTGAAAERGRPPAMESPLRDLLDFGRELVDRVRAGDEAARQDLERVLDMADVLLGRVIDALPHDSPGDFERRVGWTRRLPHPRRPAPPTEKPSEEGLPELGR
jgi:hypothetical protein